MGTRYTCGVRPTNHSETQRPPFEVGASTASRPNCPRAAKVPLSELPVERFSLVDLIVIHLIPLRPDAFGPATAARSLESEHQTEEHKRLSCWLRRGSGTLMENSELQVRPGRDSEGV